MSPDDRARLVSGWIEHFTRRIVRDENYVLRKEHGQDNLNRPDFSGDIRV